eukprot:COSAG05_NODE_7269_length_835_cov_1.126359_1_plen_218_part_01
MWLLLVLPAAAATAATQRAPAAGPSCGAISATSIVVDWPQTDDTDLYYVSLSAAEGERPFALQTTAAPSVKLIDLMPSTTYYLAVHSHPSEYNIVWGWRAPSSRIRCATTAEQLDAPHSVHRIGTAPSERSISLAWEHARQKLETSSHTSPPHSVGYRLSAAAGEAPAVWQWESVAATAAAADHLEHTHELLGLAPDHEWEVAVRDDSTGLLSEPLLM